MPEIDTDNERATPSTPATRAVQAELAAGLMARQAAVAPKFLYDALGSRLFEAICDLPEYYPTRTEHAIVAAHGEAIARAIGPGATLIDLGAGNCAKAATLFPLLHPAQYVAIDIAYDFVRGAVGALQQRFPHIEMTALGRDFSSRLALPPEVRADKRLFFYPGSSIGNFSPDEARVFLQRLGAECDPDGGLLIGIDLVKDSAVLDAAYDDALGVTAAFNLNLIARCNRELGADFDLNAFAHRAFYNAAAGRIEMHLESLRAQTARVAGQMFAFALGETIHTENSYKYQPGEFRHLATQAGFESLHTWTDAGALFGVLYLRRR